MAYDDQFYEQVCKAKKIFDNSTLDTQAENVNFDISELNQDLTFQEVALSH